MYRLLLACIFKFNMVTYCFLLFEEISYKGEKKKIKYMNRPSYLKLSRISCFHGKLSKKTNWTKIIILRRRRKKNFIHNSIYINCFSSCGSLCFTVFYKSPTKPTDNHRCPGHLTWEVSHLR